MPDPKMRRRDVLLGAGVVGASALPIAAPPAVAQPAAPAATPAKGAAPAAGPAPAGYTFLKPSEQAFVEAMVDHMIPADELTPSGTDVGLAIFIDRACAGSWGKGDRLYLQGPWKQGSANQGYQLPLTPAELYQRGIAGSNAYCRKTWGKSFDRLAAADKETFLKDLAAGKIMFAGGIPGREFFTMAYQTVMEGLFSDPIYGGNRNMVGWRMVGFPGVGANNAENIKKYNDGTRFTVEPLGIADFS